MTSYDITELPFRIAVLCYLYDDSDRVLMLHRAKSPNAGMYSPIGGKLEASLGESPHECAKREIREEAGLDIPLEQLHLTGIVSETAYEGENHWLIFLFEIMRTIRPDEIATMNIDEGALDWVKIDKVPDLEIPQTDREIMWPLVQDHRGGFFMVHIDCSVTPMGWEVRESRQ